MIFFVKMYLSVCVRNNVNRIVGSFSKTTLLMLSIDIVVNILFMLSSCRSKVELSLERMPKYRYKWREMEKIGTKLFYSRENRAN